MITTFTPGQQPEHDFAVARHHHSVHAALAAGYAAQGRSWPALEHAWAADIGAYLTATWDALFVATRAPADGFHAAVSRIAAATVAGAANAGNSDNCQHARELMRDTVTASLPTAIKERSIPLLADTPGLDALPLPNHDAVTGFLTERLDGHGTAAALSAARRFDAVTYSELAATAEDANTEIEWMYQADLATYEAHLVETAIAVNDDCLITVDLRWALAFDALAAVPALPPDPGEASSLIRRTLADTLPESGAAAIAATWQPSPQR